MFYFKLNDDNTILAFIEFKEDEKVPAFIFEHYQATSRRIITDADGKLVFEDEIDIEADANKKVAKKFAEAKATKLTEAHTMFENKRDAIIWVDTAIGYYGFDTAVEDRINFSDAAKAAELNGSTGYRVWLEQGTDKKGWREGFIVADFNKIFEDGRKQQIAAYAWFEEIKAEIEAAETAEALDAIEVK